VSGEGWEAPKRLAGWKKLSLTPGASQSVELTIDPRLLAMFDATSNTWKIAPGTYRVLLASSAKDIRETATIQLAGASLPAGGRPEAAK
jgi:beta-glucosidase